MFSSLSLILYVFFFCFYVYFLFFFLLLFVLFFLLIFANLKVKDYYSRSFLLRRQIWRVWRNLRLVDLWLLCIESYSIYVLFRKKMCLPINVFVAVRRFTFVLARRQCIAAQNAK